MLGALLAVNWEPELRGVLTVIALPLLQRRKPALVS